MRRFGKLVLSILTLLAFVPVSATVAGCGADEAQTIREENFNPEVEGAFRNMGAAREKREELEEERQRELESQQE